jgi:hypothetical protein
LAKKNTNNDAQSITQKTKDRTAMKTGVVIGKIWNDELLTEDVSIARRFRYIMKTELNKTFSFEKLPENLNYWHNVYT